MNVTNPAAFAAQFRAELIYDLGLNPRFVCPKCNINYVDDEREDTCNHRECVYDFIDTPMKEVIREWIDGVLREFRDQPVLQTRWRDRLLAAAAHHEDGV